MKPHYMLETPKAQGTSYVTIPEMRPKAEMDNQQVTQFEIGWLAGFIDGEGYIGIQGYKTHHRLPSYSCALQISNTDEQMILKAQNIIRRMGVNPYIRTHGYGERNKPKSKTVWVLIVHRMGRLIPILEMVIPFLTGSKYERAKLVLEYCQSRMRNWVPGSHHNVISDREMQIIEACIAKQKRGTSETTREAQLKNSELNRQKIESRRDRSNGRYASYKNCDDIVQPSAKAQGVLF